MNKKSINSQLRIDSGSVDIDSKLVDFLYTLMRDHLSAGVVEALVTEAQLGRESNQVEINQYSNGWLAKYAENLANRLLDK